MAGSFYGRFWDLHLRAKQDYRYFYTSTSQNSRLDSSEKRRSSSHSAKMHLPEGERTVRFNGIPDEHVKTMQNNGEMHSLEHASNGDETARINEQAAKANEIRIQLPKDSSSDAVLDTVLAAWAILVERYQRDVFSNSLGEPRAEVTKSLSVCPLPISIGRATRPPRV
ncbi:hypothetical protein P3342_000359 [Pyrenophora teres f. teres]|nr:hypothetical protein P3342_000359 [Pyrenophora teres f. teres]